MVKIGNITLWCSNKDEYDIALKIVKKYFKNKHHYTEDTLFRTITIHDIKSYDGWSKMINEINNNIKIFKHGK